VSEGMDGERLEAYLGTLRAQGVRLWVQVEDGQERLKVDAPRGVLRPRMAAAIRSLKDEILQRGYWWWGEEGDVVWWGRCAGCGARIQGVGAIRPPAKGEALCLYCAGSKRSKRS